MPVSRFNVQPIRATDPRFLHLMAALDRYQASLYPAASNHLDSVETLERSAATVRERSMAIPVSVVVRSSFSPVMLS